MLKSGVRNHHPNFNLRLIGKAPEDWRTPRPGGLSQGPRSSWSVLDCGRPQLVSLRFL